jgi:hypothetical protein
MTEKSHKKPQPGYEPETSRKKNRRAAHSTGTLGDFDTV